MRNYSLKINPFVDGWNRKGYMISDKTCALTTTSFEYYADNKNKTKFANVDPKYVAYNKIEGGAYYLGRTFRFLTSTLAVITKLFLEIMRCLIQSCELPLVKLECMVRKCAFDETIFARFAEKYSPELLCQMLLNKLSLETDYFFEDIGKETGSSALSFSDNYMNYIYHKLFESPNS